MLHHALDHTPYEGTQVRGWPVITISRGEVGLPLIYVAKYRSISLGRGTDAGAIGADVSITFGGRWPPEFREMMLEARRAGDRSCTNGVGGGIEGER
jgi:hypothetical protein